MLRVQRRARARTRVGAAPARLQKRVLDGLCAPGPAGLRALQRDVLALSRSHALTYVQEDGAIEIMPILLAPALLAAHDAVYLRRTCQLLLGAFGKTVRARRITPAVRELLPLDPDEEEWLALGPARTAPLVGRFDMNIDPARGGARRASLLELNGCAVGGIHYGPATSATVLPHVQRLLGEAARPALPASMSDAWLDLCRAQARRLRRRDLHIVWLEDREWEAGITEGPTLVEHARRAGHTAAVADPRELTLRRGEIHLGRRPVDIVYRAIEIRDLVAIERAQGRPLAGMREAVRQGRVLSPAEGDLDHKSLLEVWSSPRFAALFSPAERALLRRHVPWTRLLGERRTEGPDGHTVDLPEHARRHRAGLVFKPNRACGGEGILIGRDTSPARWERAIAGALRARGRRAVVQSLVHSPTLESPILRRGRIHLERYFTNYGLLVSPRRIGILGRASPFPVVNVSRGGGVLGVLLV
jgi:hypothetical protein